MTQEISSGGKRRMLGKLLDILGELVPIAFVGTNLAGNANITGVSYSQAEELEVGGLVTGGGIPLPGLAIVTIHDTGADVTVTLSAVIVGANAGVTFTFKPTNLEAPEVHLAVAPFTPPPEPAPADFHEATFDTYAALPLGTNSGIYTQPDGSAEIDFGDLSWTLAVDPVVGNTVVGYWIDALVGGVRTVILWEPLAPTPMVAAGNAVVLSIPVVLPGPGAATLIG